MENIKFTDNQRKIFIAISKGVKIDDLEISQEVKIVAIKYLDEKGLIRGLTNYDEILKVQLKPFGSAYLQEYPNLENPIDENDLNKFKKEEYEHKLKIRSQEKIIRNWKVFSVISAFFGFVIEKCLVLFLKFWGL